MFSARMCFVPGESPVPAVTTPGTPTITGVTILSPTSAQVNYIAPSSDGGYPITSYTLVANPGGLTKTVYTSQGGAITIDGLSQGVNYTFSIFASNETGSGQILVGSSYPLTMPVLPGAPIIGTAIATSTSTATVSYTAPTVAGTGGITNYVAYSNPDGVAGSIATSGSGTILVTNLTPGKTYSFRVYSVGTYGQGASSNSSNSITVPAGTAPGAPTLSATVLSTTSISLTWTLSPITGNSPITGTGIKYNTGSALTDKVINLTTTGSGTYTLTGLSPGTTYYLSVYAQNAFGGTYSSVVTATTLALATPSAPTIGALEATGPTTATVTYFASTNDGGSTITSYTAVSSPGGRTGVAAAASTGKIFVDGLTPGTAYTFTVYATNSIGRGASSTPSSSINTPALSPPGSPTGLALVSKSTTSITVSFVPPIIIGSSPITRYAGLASPGETNKVNVEILAGGTNQITFPNLISGIPYSITVSAINSAGSSPSSSAISVTTDTAPNASEQNYFAAGTYSWICPGGITSVSVVCIGGGGGPQRIAGGGPGGGALVYGNNIPVSPGTTYKIIVGGGGTAGMAGGTSSFNDTWLVATGGLPGVNYDYGPPNFGGAGGAGGYSGPGGNAGDVISYGGTKYAGGNGGTYSGTYANGGGNGGKGGTGSSVTAAYPAGQAGSGGGGGGGSAGDTSGGAGGGVAIYGQGENGGGGWANTGINTPGYDGYTGSGPETGRKFGGGGSKLKAAQSGGVRIIWPGNLRSFPSNNTSNVYP